MTELEEKILETVKRNQQRFKEAIDEYIKNSRKKPHNYVCIPIHIDGVINTLFFNLRLNRFTHVEYAVGVGRGTNLLGEQDAGFYAFTKT